MSFTSSDDDDGGLFQKPGEGPASPSPTSEFTDSENGDDVPDLEDVAPEATGGGGGVESSDEEGLSTLERFGPLVAKLLTQYKSDLKTNAGKLDNVEIARRTVEMLRQMLSSYKKWSTAGELMGLMRHTARELRCGLPTDPVVSNMVRRILRLIREAYAACLNGPDSKNDFGIVASMRDMLLAPAESLEFNTAFKPLRGMLISTVNDLLEEIVDSTADIAQEAFQHIHSNEIIMTTGHSTTVEEFLKKAASKRSFHVMVGEAAPGYGGQTMAMALGKAGIPTTLLSDSAIFAVMSRVNKVIIGTDTVMADGGLMASNGCHALTLAAKHHSVPVIVCAGIFQLCPKYICSYDHDDSNYMMNPAKVMGYGDAKLIKSVASFHPLLDYVPPELVNLFVLNVGTYPPSYIYQMLRKYYHEDEHD